MLRDVARRRSDTLFISGLRTSISSIVLGATEIFPCLHMIDLLLVAESRSHILSFSL